MQVFLKEKADTFFFLYCCIDSTTLLVRHVDGQGTSVSTAGIGCAESSDPLNRTHQLGLKCIVCIGGSSGEITVAKIGHSHSAV